MELKKCDVVFDQERHTYSLNGKTLGGVTPIVKWMYPETYSNVSQDVLEKAAERGTFIHENIELADGLGITPSECEEALEYITLRDEWGLKAQENEYLVTDGKEIASSIDIVYDDLSIADIKCTSKIHVDNVQLQLSIYSYLFEMMNGVKPKRLLVVWLPRAQYGKPKIIELDCIPSDVIEQVLAGYLSGESNEKYLPLLQSEHGLQIVNRDILLQIDSVERQMAALQEQQKTLRETLREAMKKHGVTKWETDYFKISLGNDTQVTSFDAKRYQAEHNDLCAPYMVTSTRKGRFTLTLK